MPKGIIDSTIRYCHICGRILERSETKQLVERDFDTKKEKLIFDLCPTCLDTIRNMEVPKDSLKLHTTQGKRLWTEKQIADYINSSDEAMMKALKQLFQKQTDDEQKTRETKYDNAVGFNKPDSNFLTGMSKKYIAEDCKIDNFTEKQLSTIRDKMQKYITQLTIIANS